MNTAPFASTKAAEAVPRRRWTIAVLLGFGVLVNYFDRVNISVAHDALRNEFGISNVTFGYLSGAFNWTYAALQLPMGILLDRFGVQALGRLSALLWSVASFGAALAPGVGSFLGMRLFLGVGEAPTFPAYAKATGYWFPRQERSLATAFFDAAAKFGPAIGVILIGLLIIHFGWRWGFAMTGALSFLFFLAFYFFYRDPQDDPKLSKTEWNYMVAGGVQQRRAKGATQSASLGYLLRQPKVLGLVLGFFGYNYCFYLLLYWLPSYFSALHLSETKAAFYSSIPWIFATLMDLFVGGYLVDSLIRRGHGETIVRQSVLIGGTILGLAIAGAMFTHNPAISVCWISLALGGLSAAAPVGWSIPALIAPRDSTGKVGGILNFGNQVAGISAPIITGYFAGPTNSFGRAFAAAAVVLLLGICSYIFLLGKIEQVPEPEEN